MMLEEQFFLRMERFLLLPAFKNLLLPLLVILSASASTSFVASASASILIKLPLLCYQRSESDDFFSLLFANLTLYRLLSISI